jgi:hypothetical protein
MVIWLPRDMRPNPQNSPVAQAITTNTSGYETALWSANDSFNRF